MRHIFIVNPMAGKTNVEQLQKKIREVFQETDYEIVLTKGPKDATKLAREYARNCREVCLYACGGDGTLNEVLNGMYRYDNACLGIIPIGTGNDFIKALAPKWKRKDFLNLEGYRDGQKIACDVLKVDDTVVLNTVSAGLDASVAENVNRYKKLPALKGSMPYYCGLLHSMVNGIHHTFQLAIDGKVLPREEYTFVVGCNGRFYGGGYQPCPDAKVDDGLIDVCLVRKVTRRKILRLSGKYKKGEHVNAKYQDLIAMYRCKKLQLFSDHDINVNVDGEVLRMRNPEIRILPKQITLYLPQ